MEFVGVKPEAEEEKKPQRPMKHSTRVIRQRLPESLRRVPSAPEDAPKKVLLKAPTEIPAEIRNEYQAPTTTTTTAAPLRIQTEPSASSSPSPEIRETRYEARLKPGKRIIRVYGRRPSAQNLVKAVETKGVEGQVAPRPKAENTHHNLPYIVQFTPKSKCIPYSLIHNTIISSNTPLIEFLFVNQKYGCASEGMAWETNHLWHHFFGSPNLTRYDIFNLILTLTYNSIYSSISIQFC
jgi:hypothetical protein